MSGSGPSKSWSLWSMMARAYDVSLYSHQLKCQPRWSVGDTCLLVWTCDSKVLISSAIWRTLEVCYQAAAQGILEYNSPTTESPRAAGIEGYHISTRACYQSRQVPPVEYCLAIPGLSAHVRRLGVLQARTAASTINQPISDHGNWNGDKGWHAPLEVLRER